MPAPKKAYSIDMTGKKFGHLSVTKLAYVHPIRGEHYWECVCDCGNVAIKRGSHLRYGETTTCSQKCKYKNSRPGIGFGLASFNALYAGYRSSAIKRGYVFDLSKEEFLNITKQNCFYCGKLPSSVYHPKECIGEYVYNGIDRFDNSFGYTVSNCVPCCGECNKSKLDRSAKDFNGWIVKVYNNYVKNMWSDVT